MIAVRYAIRSSVAVSGSLATKDRSSATLTTRRSYRDRMMNINDAAPDNMSTPDESATSSTCTTSQYDCSTGTNVPAGV